MGSEMCIRDRVLPDYKWKLAIPLRLSVKREGVDDERVGIIDIEVGKRGENAIITHMTKTKSQSTGRN